MERCELYYIWTCKTNTKAMSIKKELSIAADKIIDHKSEIFNLWKHLEQLNILKKIILNENQNHMINTIGLKNITNRIEKEKELPDDNCKELKDIEEEKIEERNKRLIEYYKWKKENNIENVMDELLMYYLEDNLKIRIREEVNNTN